jgi:transglutaminase-like putative cysteine protease
MNITGLHLAACRSWLLCAVTGIALATATPAAIGAENADVQVDAIIFVNGLQAGTYHERTVYEAGRIEDTVEQDFVINRLGSRVEISLKDVNLQDRRGRLTSGHFESSSSKSIVATDLVVRGETLALTMHSGDRSYNQNIAFAGELLGPEGMRLLIANARGETQTLQYRTFISALGSVADISLKPIAREILVIDGANVETQRLQLSIAGLDTPSTLWVDDSGHTVRMIQDSPFGPVEVRRSINTPPGPPAGADLPAESYENTLALSTIRLPHPRQLKTVTVELTRKNSAVGDWPTLASTTQKVLLETPVRIVLELSQTRMRAKRDSAPQSLELYLRPNSLMQSDDPEVLRIAHAVVGKERDSWKAALALQRWTYQHMHFDPGIAIAPASEVARDRHGTCVGYSILLASLARAANIPSRMKMGYVYDSGIWAGHAWVEVLIHGQWLAIDAAEYMPGIADAARIGVITVTGQTGTIEGAAELGKLYSRVNIRTLSYRLSKKTVVVGAHVEDHTMRGNEYSNPWLKLRVRKPADSSFEDLDAHWPSPVVVTVKQDGSTASVLYGRADPYSFPSEVAARVVKTLNASDPPSFVRWATVPAVRAHNSDNEEIVAVVGDAYWAIIASGAAAHAFLDQMLRATSIADLD